MKTSVFLLSSLLFALVINLSAAEKVFDIDGQELRPGASYYILPYVRGNGGGLKLSGGRFSQCPMDVVQEPNEVNSGLPVTFSPANFKERTVFTSSDLNIKFLASSVCGQSTVWRLDGGKTGSAQLSVSTGGMLGSPGSATINNWFKIEKMPGRNNSYKLVYCPQVCRTCRPICGDLGINIEKSGTRRLVLNTGKPFQVFFKKA